MRAITVKIGKFRSRREASPRWVTGDIGLLAAGRGSAWAPLRSEHLGAAIDLRTSGEGGTQALAPPPGITVRWHPIEDHGAPTLPELVDVSGWVVTQIERGSRVVIACREGRGRSPLLACAALMHLGYSAEDAYRLVRRAQPAVALSDVQVRVLEELSRS